MNYLYVYMFLLFFRRKFIDKSETTPFLNSASTVSPSAPVHSGTSTINRTLLHHQQNGVNTRNGATPMATATLRGLAISSNLSDSPPPDYHQINIAVHDTSRHGFFFSFIYYLFYFIAFQIPFLSFFSIFSDEKFSFHFYFVINPSKPISIHSHFSFINFYLVSGFFLLVFAMHL